MKNIHDRGVWIQDPDPFFSGSGKESHPDPVCPERLDLDLTKIRPDLKPSHTHLVLSFCGVQF